jgi:hypothetical protein
MIYNSTCLMYIKLILAIPYSQLSRIYNTWLLTSLSLELAV